jgi:hypothetical protein
MRRSLGAKNRIRVVLTRSSPSRDGLNVSLTPVAVVDCSRRLGQWLAEALDLGFPAFMAAWAGQVTQRRSHRSVQGPVRVQNSALLAAAAAAPGTRYTRV